MTLTPEQIEAMEPDWTKGLDENFERLKAAALDALAAAERRAGEAEEDRDSQQRIAIAVIAERDTLRARVAELEKTVSLLRSASRGAAKIVDAAMKKDQTND
jgi:predicted NUDIX family phosphoesterase